MLQEWLWSCWQEDDDAERRYGMIKLPPSWQSTWHGSVFKIIINFLDPHFSRVLYVSISRSWILRIKHLNYPNHNLDMYWWLHLHRSSSLLGMQIKIISNECSFKKKYHRKMIIKPYIPWLNNWRKQCLFLPHKNQTKLKISVLKKWYGIGALNG